MRANAHAEPARLTSTLALADARLVCECPAFQLKCEAAAHRIVDAHDLGGVALPAGSRLDGRARPIVGDRERNGCDKNGESLEDDARGCVNHRMILPRPWLRQ